MNSKIIYDESEEIISIDEEYITFKINKAEEKKDHELKLISKTKIILRNLTLEYVAFRVRTTKKQFYKVIPTYYILSPKENKLLEIFYYFKNENSQTDTNNDHKFKFEGFIISENDKNKGVKDLFYEYQQKNEKVKGTIIKKKVKFIEENDNGLTYYANEEDLKHIEKLEDLKIKYYKNKNIIDNLRINYDNIKTRLNLEYKSIENKNAKIIYNIPEIKEKPISRNIFIFCFIAAILIGFFLTK